MPRKRKSTTPETPADTATATAEPPAAPKENEPAATDGQPGFAERVGPKMEMPIPDPFGIAKDSVAGVQLFESRRDRQMAIKFEDKPSQPVIDTLKDAGYRWNPSDRIWTQPVWPASAMSTRIRAERLYQEVCQMIRKEKGMEEPEREIPF
jgi:hypothetical protein